MAVICRNNSTDFLHNFVKVYHTRPVFFVQKRTYLDKYTLSAAVDT